MKNVVLILMVIIIGISSAVAQTKPSTVPKTSNNKQGASGPGMLGDKALHSKKIIDRLFIGGNLGGGMQAGAYAIDVSPYIGYYIDEKKKFSVGAGPILQWQGGGNISANALGGMAFARYNIFNQPSLFVQSEFNYQRLTLRLLGTDIKESYNIPALLLGGGLNMNGGFIAVLYDFLWDEEKSLNPIPLVIRGGFNFNLR